MLKTAIKSKSQVLKHLNHVINICLLLNASAKIEEHSDRKPIRCRAVTEWSRLLQRDSLNLTCVLDNSSPYALERGWTLSICVSSLSHPPSEGGHCSSTNYSFPFQNVNPGETLEVSLPLADAGEAFFPLMVSCSLHFSLASLLGAEEANCPGLQNSCINLPLNTLWVDWLHSLRLNGPEAAHKKDTAQHNNAAVDSIQAFINSHQFSRRGADEGRGGALRPERYSASVQVSSELLKNTKGSNSSDSEGHARSRCVSFLEWLLSEGCGGVRRGHTGDQISGPVLHARGPNGHAVKLTAKEVNADPCAVNYLSQICKHLHETRFPGNCWGGGHREAGVLDYSAASDGELVHGCSLWTASCCSASVTGTCTCREMSTPLLISRTRSVKDTCVSLPVGG